MNEFTLSQDLDKNKFFLINLSEIEERFDPEFYRPSIRNFNHYKIQFQKLNIFTNSVHHPPEYERNYSESGYQLLRAQNVRPTGIELENNQVFFSKEFLKEKKLVFPEIGDVLVVRSGVNAGDTAVVEEQYENVIIGADNLLVKVTNEIIPKFLQVFFYTNLGKSLMSRYLTGATNKHINPTNLKKIPIPIVDKEIQKKAIQIFEDVLEQKELNEKRVENILSTIDNYLLDELGINLPISRDSSLEKRIFTISLKEVSGDRFDPYYFDYYFDKLLDLIQKCKFPLIPIQSIATQIDTGKTPPKKSYVDEDDTNKIPIIKAGSHSDDLIDLNKCDFVDEEFVGNEAKQGDIFLLSAAHQPEYVGKIVYFLEEELKEKTYFVGELLRISPDINKYNPIFLFALLKSNIYSLLLNREKRGQTSHLYPSDVRKIQIPFPLMPKQEEIAEHISEIRYEAFRLKEQTNEALKKASQEIEKILLGD